MAHPFSSILDLLSKLFGKWERSKESRDRLDAIKRKAEEAMKKRKELGRRPLNDKQRERLNAIMAIDVDEDERLRLLAKFDNETAGTG